MSHAASPTPPSQPPRIPFEAQPFRAWLTGWLALGDELAEGWSLDDVYPFGPWEVALTLVHPDHEDTLRLKVRLRNDEAPAAARSEQLDILYRAPHGDDARREVMGRLARAFADAAGGHEAEVVFVGDQPTVTHAAAKEGPPPAFNLALPSPCHQRCAFCAIFEEIKPVADAHDSYVELLRADIVRSAAQGTRVLRVNGIEPLTAPYVWELMDRARDAGFDEFHVLSTFRPIKDAADAARLLDAMPATYRFYVPLYGSCAEVHDAVTGAPGSFEETMTATELLRAEMRRRGQLDGEHPPGQIIVTTILLRHNVADLHAMAVLLQGITWSWEIHLPFPNTSSSRDPYRGIAVTMTEALEGLAPEGFWAAGEVPLGEILPCIALAHERRTGHELLTPERLTARRREPSGTYYETVGFTHSLGEGEPIAFTSATVPCPSADQCVLAPACPRKVYVAYADEHGLDELVPATREDVAALAHGEAVLGWLAKRG